MLAKLKVFFSFPVFEDDDKTRIARLLLDTLLILVLVAVLRAILSIGASQEYMTVTLRGNASLFLTACVIFLLIRAGYVRFACIFFTIYQWGVIAWITYIYGGVSLSVYSFFVFVIFVSGLLLGGKWAAGYAVISVLYGTLLLYLENQGILSPWDEDTVGAFNTITPSFITTAVIVYLYHRDITRALKRERHNAAQLARANDQLSSEVVARERVEEQLLQARKMEAIGRLSGGIAHDFNNLLVPIIGYIELGMLDLSPNSKAYEYLAQVKEAAERAAGLTRQILAFSRQQVLEIEVIDLNDIIIQFRKIIQHMIRENIELETALSPNPILIKADKSQIDQVLMNLVINSCDAMPQGGKITITAERVELDEIGEQPDGEALPSGCYALLTVSDTGFGMDATIREKVFEPFFTTKERERGTGLGLATVFGIVKQHQGGIRVYSEPGRGTTFRVYLPASDDMSTGSRRLSPASELVRGTETVLVVEDNEAVRKFVCETLRQYGYKVLEARSPADGLRLATGHDGPIHLLLTDVVMPGMNGQEVYQAVTVVCPDMKVLYMSGYTDNVIAHHGILDADVHLLQKPFKVDMLLRKVRNALE